ncbi:MAG: transglycosylase SLT domain-containing protein [Alphaproteobacteria bacterium]|nr:transglycosylase SLT domain-containing protein [Alphaproteobacteria bacterium]
MVTKNLLWFCFVITLFIHEGHARVSIPLGVQKPSNNETKSSLESSTNCQEIISHFEKQYGIPDKLLASIAMVESRNSPWAVYALKKSRFFSTQEGAIDYIQKLKAKGVKNINIGCMQINLQSHGRRFKSLKDILPPYHNIAYAAKLMKVLYAQYGSWEMAVKHYHSSSSIYNVSYKDRVFSVWAHKKGETYTASSQSVSWNQKQASSAMNPHEEKQPLIKIAFGPGAGVSKQFLKNK